MKEVQETAGEDMKIEYRRNKSEQPWNEIDATEGCVIGAESEP